MEKRRNTGIGSYRFYKQDGVIWYADLPDYPGNKEDLIMVAGADKLLEDLSEGNDEIVLCVSESKFPGCSKLRLIGKTGTEGDLSENSSPRWKQRAFYDYLRDVFAMISRIPLIRISVYDKFNIGHQLKSAGNILTDNNSYDLNEITKFIERKAIL